MNSITPKMQRKIVQQSEIKQVQKLGSLQTYFALLKGFMSLGILFMPKNCRNGGWLFSLGTMVTSFFITHYCLVKLLEAREKAPPGSSFTEIATSAMGKRWKWVVDLFLAVMQFGFVISFTYFFLESI
jgi:amino acid permease